MKIESLKKMLERKKRYCAEIKEKINSDGYIALYSDGHILGYYEGQIDLLEELINCEEMKESSE